MDSNVEKLILQVDMGGSINSIKELKQHIESCKGAMVGFGRETEEYKALAKTAAEEQEKLNQIMIDSKSGTDAAAGSYNALSKEMSELKKQWRATADEIERAQLGEKINAINDQLKDMDASIGNYQRNVGNYANDFSKAMKPLEGELSRINPSLGVIIKSFGTLKGSINATATAGVTGLKKVKAAFMSNPIGILLTVIATEIALIAKNWDTVVMAFTKGGVKAEAVLQNTHKQLEKNNQAIKEQTELMKAKGATDEEVLLREIELMDQNIEQWDEYVDLVVEKYGQKSKKAKEAFDELNEKIEEQKEALVKARNSMEEYLSKIEKNEAQSGMTKLEIEIDNVKKKSETLKKLAGKMFDEGILNAKEYQSYLQRIREDEALAIKQATENNKSTGAGESKWMKEEREIQERNKKIADSFKTERELREAKYQEDLKLYKKHKKDTALLDKEYKRDMDEITRKEEEAQKKADEAWTNRVNATLPKITVLKDAMEEAFDVLEDIAKVEEALDGNTFGKNFQITPEIKKMLDELGTSESEWDVFVAEAKKAYAETYSAYVAEKMKEEGWSKENERKTAEEIFNINNAWWAEDANNRIKIDKDRAYTQIEIEEERAKALYEIQKAELDKEEQIIRATIANGSFPKEVLEDYQDKLYEIKEQKRQMDVLREKEASEYRLELAQQELDAQLAMIDQFNEAYQSFSNDISTILGSIASLYEQNISLMEESGDVSEKEMERKKKGLKALKIVETTVACASIAADAASGIMSVWKGYAAETGVINTETAAATGPAAAATKAALDAKSLTSAILKTAMITTNATASMTAAIAGTVASLKGMSSSAGSSAAATPTIDPYQPNYTANLTSQTETDNLVNAMSNANIWVSVSDIERGLGKAKVTQEESTF